MQLEFVGVLAIDWHEIVALFNSLARYVHAFHARFVPAGAFCPSDLAHGGHIC